MFADRLEDNLKKKVELLEHIYESDDRIRKMTDPEKSEFEDFDAYLYEMQDMIEELEENDNETDEIRSYLETHKEELNSISNEQSNRIRRLLSEIEGKTQAVRDIELQAKQIVDDFLKKKRTDIKNVRKQSRVVQNIYTPQRIMTSEEMITFDTKN